MHHSRGNNHQAHHVGAVADGERATVKTSSAATSTRAVNTTARAWGSARREGFIAQPGQQPVLVFVPLGQVVLEKVEMGKVVSRMRAPVRFAPVKFT